MPGNNHETEKSAAPSAKLTRGEILWMAVCACAAVVIGVLCFFIYFKTKPVPKEKPVLSVAETDKTAKDFEKSVNQVLDHINYPKYSLPTYEDSFIDDFFTDKTGQTVFRFTASQSKEYVSSHSSDGRRAEYAVTLVCDPLPEEEQTYTIDDTEITLGETSLSDLTDEGWKISDTPVSGEHFNNGSEIKLLTHQTDGETTAAVGFCFDTGKDPVVTGFSIVPSDGAVPEEIVVGEATVTLNDKWLPIMRKLGNTDIFINAVQSADEAGKPAEHVYLTLCYRENGPSFLYEYDPETEETAFLCLTVSQDMDAHSPAASQRKYIDE